MEEKKEDLLKNLKKINSLGSALTEMKGKMDALKSGISGINKRVIAKEKQIKAAEEERIKLEKLHEAELAAQEVSLETLVEENIEKQEASVDNVNIPESMPVSEEKAVVDKPTKTRKSKSVEKAAEVKPVVSDEPREIKTITEKVEEAESEEVRIVSTEKSENISDKDKVLQVETKPEKKTDESAEIKKTVDPVRDEKAQREARRRAVEEAQARALAEARAKILEQKKKEAIARGEDPNLVTLPSQQPRVYEPKSERKPFSKDGARPLRREYVPNDARRPTGARPAAGGLGAGRSPRPFGTGTVGKKPVEVTFIPKDNGKSFGNKKKSNDRGFDDKKAINKKSLIKTQVSVDDFDENKSGYRKLRTKKDKRQDASSQAIKIEKAVINKEIIPIKELSEKIGISAIEITKKLFKEGIMKTINDSVDYDTAGVIAADLGIELELKLDKTAEDVLNEAFDVQDNADQLIKRPPVVTVMGHVDHGKTSLLDRIRSANVTATEAGGITQHIGAYTVTVNDEKITFLDTPGHAAFTAMRARGAQITDIAIIVVAADDGIMPQTIEAIHHAQAAGVSIIVAANKIDKPQANVEKLKQQLADQSVLIEEWGGDVAFVPVSAKTGEGIDNLLETILLTADVKELKANPDRMAKGAIIEAKLDKGKGPVATVLIQNGTLHTGDNLVAGTITGRVRAMIDDKGRTVKEAGPSTPVSILGLEEVPNAGDLLFAVEQDKLSKLVAQERKNKEREDMIKQSQKVTLDDLFSKISDGNLKALNIVIKADVQGSVEALKQSLEELTNEEVKVNVLHAGVGAINESDVILADSSNAIIIGFNVRPDANAKVLAERSKVDVRLYRIIYEAIDDVKNAMKGLIAPKTQEIYMGKAEVRQTFKITGVGMVAGCYVVDGKIIRNGKLRIYRDDVMICEGNVNQLKRFKDDVKEVSQGFECGISIENFNDIQIGDFIESYLIEVKPVV